MDPETPAEQDAEEAFENIILLEPVPSSPDDDWVAGVSGEFDID